MRNIKKSLCILSLLLTACRTTSEQATLAGTGLDGQDLEICEAYAKQPESPKAKTIAALIKSMRSRDCENLLQKIDKVTELSLVGKGLTDLTILGRALNLESLDLSDNSLTSLAPLAKLKKLQYLGVSQNKIQSLPVNSDWPSMLRLDLSSNSLVALDGIELLPALESLNISDNKIVELTLLSSSDQLKILEANNNNK